MALNQRLSSRRHPRLRHGARRVCHQAARSLRAVRARIESLDGMSVHADEGELFTWLRDGEGVPDVVYIIDGDEAARSTLADRIVRDLGWLAVLPRHGEIVRVD